MFLALAAVFAARSCATGRGPVSRLTTGDRAAAVEWMAFIVNRTIQGEPVPDRPDPWGTPYAVFVLRGEKYEPGVFESDGQQVTPAENVRRYPPAVQVISAGPDRVFGTADDLHSWDKFTAE